jgi:hypothetical protein
MGFNFSITLKIIQQIIGCLPQHMTFYVCLSARALRAQSNLKFKINIFSLIFIFHQLIFLNFFLIL